MATVQVNLMLKKMLVHDVDGNYSVKGKLLSMVPTTCHLNIRKMETGGSDVQVYP